MEDMKNTCTKSVNLRPPQVGESHETGYFHVSTHLDDLCSPQSRVEVKV